MYIVPQQILLYKYGIEFITEKVHQYLLQVGSNKNNKKKMLNILNKKTFQSAFIMHDIIHKYFFLPQIRLVSIIVSLVLRISKLAIPIFPTSTQ